MSVRWANKRLKADVAEWPWPEVDGSVLVAFDVG